MKVIISHDIDHISATEHLLDLFLVKYIFRNSIELFGRHISWSEFFKRILIVLNNKLNNVNELVEFDKAHNVDSTFFIAVRNGLSLSYNKKKATLMAKNLLNKGIPIGIHGIAYENFELIEEERISFNEITKLNSFGIRMHYLRFDNNTLNYLKKAGYTFDSSIYSLDCPSKTGNLWEFPIQIMDTNLFYSDSRFQIKSFEQIKKETVQLIEKVENAGINYLNINTHDFYFSDAFKNCKKWYIWLITYLISKGYEFQNYNRSVEELDILGNQSVDNINLN